MWLNYWNFVIMFLYTVNVSKESPAGSNPGILSALDNIRDQLLSEKCPVSEGFFFSPITSRCFKVFKHRKVWTEADAGCKSDELYLAEPLDTDAVWLQHTLRDNYGASRYYVGGRGNGVVFKWQRSGNELPSDSLLWMKDEPTSVSNNNCLYIAAVDKYLTTQPGHPYREWPCSQPRYYVCERII